jgi:hypothetical protein
LVRYDTHPLRLGGTGGDTGALALAEELAEASLEAAGLGADAAGVTGFKALSSVRT